MGNGEEAGGGTPNAEEESGGDTDVVEEKEVGQDSPSKQLAQSMQELTGFSTSSSSSSRKRKLDTLSDGDCAMYEAPPAKRQRSNPPEAPNKDQSVPQDLQRTGTVPDGAAH